MTTKSTMTKEELQAYFDHKKAQERKWGERYRARQKLLRAKLDELNITVSDEEVDAELQK